MLCALNLPVMNIDVQSESGLRRSDRLAIFITMSTATTGIDTDIDGTQGVTEVHPGLPTQREAADDTDTDLPPCSYTGDPVPDMDDHTLTCSDCFAYYRLEN